MKNASELLAAHFTKLEEFLSRLFAQNLADPLHYGWKFQLDLAHYQIDIQENIRESKGEKDKVLFQIAAKSKERKPWWKKNVQKLQAELEELENILETLRHVHFLSRQIGSCLAWILLENNEAYISPLSENVRVGETSSGFSLQGVIAMASEFLQAGVGFPIIHDVTDCLRIGDITFIHPPDEPVTVEVKTHLLEQSDKRTELSVLVVGPGDSERWMKALHSHNQNPTQEPPVSRHPNSLTNQTLIRQLSRMAQARIMQLSKHGDVLDIPRKDMDRIIVRPEFESSAYHRHLVKPMALAAKDNGFAIEVVDDAILYFAYFGESSPILMDSTQELEQYMDELKSVLSPELDRCLPSHPEPGRNITIIGSSFDLFSRAIPPYIRPIFLYPLEQEELNDLLWGRLHFLVYINLGKLADALEAVGFSVEILVNQQGIDQNILNVSKSLTVDGQMAVMSLLQHQLFMSKLKYEFLSVSAYVTFVEEAFKISERHKVS